MTAPRELYEPYEQKALRSLAGAEAELAAGRYDNAIALAYYACFQMAVALLIRNQVPPDRRTGYSHGMVISDIRSRLTESVSPDQASAIDEIYSGRIVAQYRPDSHTSGAAELIVDQASRIVEFLQSQPGDPDEERNDGSSDQEVEPS